MPKAPVSYHVSREAYMRLQHDAIDAEISAGEMVRGLIAKALTEDPPERNTRIKKTSVAIDPEMFDAMCVHLKGSGVSINEFIAYVVENYKKEGA